MGQRIAASLVTAACFVRNRDVLADLSPLMLSFPLPPWEFEEVPAAIVVLPFHLY